MATGCEVQGKKSIQKNQKKGEGMKEEEKGGRGANLLQTGAREEKSMRHSAGRSTKEGGLHVPWGKVPRAVVQ